MTSFTPRVLAVATICAALSAPAIAQEQGGFLDNIFGRPNAPRQEQQVAQLSGADMVVRFERLENQIRQLTGVIEQLQFRNQQLEQQLKRMQDDNEFRFQELGARGGAQPQMQSPAQPPARQPGAPQRRGDAFDPSQNPNAPGTPRTLGGAGPATAAAAPPQDAGDDEPPVGVPGGRTAGAPLDLSTLSANASRDPALAPDGQQASLGSQPPPSARNPNTTGAQPNVAAAPPSQTPRDEFALGYGYLQRRDYALAEETLRDFLKKYPRDRLAAEAEFWVGESLFQRQRYRDAAESFLRVSTKYNGPAKAPDALLRLAQSLAALGEKETACGALGEVISKYPKAPAALRQTVEREQKRVKC